MDRKAIFQRNLQAGILRAGSRRNLAKSIGTSDATLYNWRNKGRDRASGHNAEALNKLAELLGYNNAEELFIREPTGFSSPGSHSNGSSSISFRERYKEELIRVREAMIQAGGLSKFREQMQAVRDLVDSVGGFESLQQYLELLEELGLQDE